MSTCYGSIVFILSELINMYLNIFYFTFNTINIYVVHINENILKILYAQLVAQFV